jgi:hypothetical protein
MIKAKKKAAYFANTWNVFKQILLQLPVFSLPSHTSLICRDLFNRPEDLKGHFQTSNSLTCELTRNATLCTHLPACLTKTY